MNQMTTRMKRMIRAICLALALMLPMKLVAANGDEKVYPVRDRLEVVSLDGTWDFKYMDGDWTYIEVPGNWATQGIRLPQYGSGLDEVEGICRRRFRYDSRWDGRKVMLRMGGVLFGYEVSLNGRKVGSHYTGSAYLPAQYEITDFLRRDGLNEIEVKVSSRSSAWLFDTNDCWALVGIFRDVEIFSVDKDAWIEDITFRTQGSHYTCDVKVHGDAVAQVALVDHNGIQVAEGKHLWSHEDPHLYDLVVTLVDKQGKKIQRVVEKVGFRDMEFTREGMYVNGRRTLLKGVAWNEIDPVEGRAISYRERRRQMELMKRAGVNAIRTAHYPFGPDFYELCDEMGFYVVDEVPFGSRGRDLLASEDYLQELLARTEGTIGMDKNHPCVAIRTFGNENAVQPNTIKVLDYARELDPTRPRALPQVAARLVEWTSSGNYPYDFDKHVEIFSGHYPSMPHMLEMEKTDKPIMMTEYAHSLGNGFSNFEEAYKEMSESGRWLGGFIWVWADQSILHDGREFSGSGEDSPEGRDWRRQMPLGFQGNHLDDRRLLDSWADRGTDGIVYGNGTPKEAYQLVKRLYGGRGAKEGNGRKGAVSEGIPGAEPAQIMVRIDRRHGLIPTLNGKEKGQGEYLIRDWKKVFRGSIRISRDGKVEYDLRLRDKYKDLAGYEIGIAVDLGTGYERVDWEGLGIWTSTPGKTRMNAEGVWALHKDDYRFQGNRGNVKTVWVSNNAGGEGRCLESSSGNVSFENVDGHIILTECLHVSPYGGKNAVADVTLRKKVGDVPFKGSFRILAATMPPSNPAIVPDLTFTETYGF